MNSTFTRCSLCYPVIKFACGFLFGVCIVNVLALIFLKRGVCSTAAGSTNISSALPDLSRSHEPFLLIGVLSTWHNLNTKAAAIYRTWAKDVPGKIIFFIGKGEKYRGKLPVVALDDVSDTTYPPQKKCFSMIKYMHDNYLHQFEWFMRADDDLFVKPEYLERFLKSVNSSRRWYVGHPGLGRPKEKGKLGLPGEKGFYCMGGPGILFTKETLRLTVPALSSCLNDTVTSHEDTELGRCVQKNAGLFCTSAAEFSDLFFQNYKEENVLFREVMYSKLIYALTLHPVKQPTHVYELFYYFNTQHILKLRQKMSQLVKVIDNLHKRFPPPDSKRVNDLLEQTSRQNAVNNESMSEDNERVDGLNMTTAEKGVSENVNKDSKMVSEVNTQPDMKEKEDAIWEFIRKGNVYSYKIPFNEPFEQVKLKGRQLGLAASIGALNEFTSASEKPVFSYVKVSPKSGLEHITGTEENKSILKSYVSLQRFQLTEIAEDSTFVGYGDKTIHVILPLYKRSATFARFIKQLNSSLSGYPGDVLLRVVLYSDETAEYLRSAKYAEMFSKPDSRFNTEILIISGTFSRGNAIKTGLRGLPPDSLILIVDVDMTFKADFLHRVFLNTKLGKQVYFPIPFTQYYKQAPCYTNPENCSVNKTDFDFGQDTGMWRYFGYGIVGIYNYDVTRVGGFSGIQGWGKEDAEFFDKCLKHGLKVLRSVDTSLVHLYHNKTCDVSLPRDQFKMCTESREELYASQSTLANILFNTSNVE